MCELALKLGMGATLSKEQYGNDSTIYRISTTETTLHKIRKERRSVIQYDGIVYDVTVPSHHVIMTRRNGRCVWSGNCYGPEGAWNDGREKAPAALCRKIAEAELTGDPEVEIWGDGGQIRSYMYVQDCVEGLLKVMKSDYPHPLNIGRDREISVDDLADTIAQIAGVEITKVHVDGPEGVRRRNSDNWLCRHILEGWEPRTPVEEGLVPTYQWVRKQVLKDG
jgi:hypothetical protein